MTEGSSPTFYHAISQSRLQASSQRDSIPGLSKDSESQNLGMYLSENIPSIVRNRYGRESAPEENAEVVRLMRNLVGTVRGEEAARDVDMKKVLSPIIIEVGGLDEARLSPSQYSAEDTFYFYKGDMDWDKVKSLHVPKGDAETAEVADEIASEVQKRGINIEVRTYDPTEMDREVQFEHRTETNVNPIQLKRGREGPRLDPEGKF